MDEEVKIVVRPFNGVGRLYAVTANGEAYPIQNWYDDIIIEKPANKPDVTNKTER